MNLLAITPDEFKTQGLSWVEAVTAVVTGAAVAAAVLLPKLQSLIATVNALIHSRDKLQTDVAALQKSVVDVALKTPAPPTETK